MADNVIIVGFDDDSKAYQALSEVGEANRQGGLEVRTAVIVERSEDGRVVIPEGTDNREGYLFATGGLVGGLLGALGGPLGILLFGSLGALTGGVAEAGRDEDGAVALDILSARLPVGKKVLLVEAWEPSESIVDAIMAPLDGTVARRSSADVHWEVEAAHSAQEAADHEARRVLREEKKSERKEKWEAFKEKAKHPRS